MRIGLLGLVLILLCFSSVRAFGQEIPDLSALHRQRAARELEVILNDTTRLTDKSAYVKVRARAGGLLWLQDRARARGIFSELWTWIEKQDDKNFSKDDARTSLLSYLFQRDSKLARELLDASPTGGKESNISSKHLNKLTSELIESDPAAAAELLAQSIITKPSPEALPLLSRLREKDAGLADGIAERLLDVILLQPTDIALPTVYALNYYVFPAQNITSDAAAVIAPQDSLRRHYFTSSYGVLTRSLQEAKQTSQGNPRGREEHSGSFFQVQIAELLAALSGRYAPNHSTELQGLATQLSAGMPSEFAQVAQAMLRRVNNGASLAGVNYDVRNQTGSPESKIILALAHNDFNEAEQLLGDVESVSVKKKLSSMIASAEFKYHIVKEDIGEALRMAQGTEDSDTRVSMFAQIAEISLKKANEPSSAQILAMARGIIRKADCTPVKAVTMLSLASDSAPASTTDAVEWLRDGATCLNSLDPAKSKVDKVFTKDNLTTFAGGQEFRRAFSAVGRIDFDNTLLVADILDDSLVRLTAKLSACEKWLGVVNEKSSTVSVMRGPEGKPRQ